MPGEIVEVVDMGPGCLGQVISQKEDMFTFLLGSGITKHFLVVGEKIEINFFGQRLVLDEDGIRVWRKKEMVMQEEIKEIVAVNDRAVYSGAIVDVRAMGVTPSANCMITLRSQVDGDEKTFLIPPDKLECQGRLPHSLRGETMEIKDGRAILAVKK